MKLRATIVIDYEAPDDIDLVEEAEQIECDEDFLIVTLHEADSTTVTVEAT